MGSRNVCRENVKPTSAVGTERNGFLAIMFTLVAADLPWCVQREGGKPIGEENAGPWRWRESRVNGRKHMFAVEKGKGKVGTRSSGT